MTTLIAGASGATGRLLTRELLNRGQNVRIIVRNKDKLPDEILNHENLTVIPAAILDLSHDEMARHVKGCDAVASCLGHNMSFKGMYGKPRRLVTEALSRLCRAVKSNKPEKPVKVLLMNSTGCRNPDLAESIPVAQKLVIGALRLLVPPHLDNEKASAYLRRRVGQNDPFIQWSVIRPDKLTDREETSPYETFPSPTRSAIFDSGETSRINVAHFMSDLITDDLTWKNWKGRTPVIYNK